MKKPDVNFINRIANDCRQATFLIEKRESVDLTEQEKNELAIHLSGCSICREYQRQSALITQLVDGTSRSFKEFILDDDFKTHLQQQIDDHQAP